jgi:hypothetical protein
MYFLLKSDNIFINMLGQITFKILAFNQHRMQGKKGVLKQGREQ